MNNSKLPSVSPLPPEFSLLSIARMLWKKKVVIVLLWVIFTGAGMFYIRRIPAVYSAEAIILVDRQKIPERFVATTVNSNVQDRLSYITEQILSSRRLTAVLTDFDLFPGQQWQRTPEEYAERIREDITVGTDRPGPKARQGVIRLGFKGTNRNVVASVANRLANLLIEENLKTREVMAEGTTEFIDSQLQEAKKTLDDLENSLSRFKMQYNGELPQQEQQVTAALGRLQTAFEGNRDAMNRANQTILTLENSIRVSEAEDRIRTEAIDLGLSATALDRGATVVARVGQEPAVPLKQSETIARQLATLRSRYGENHPDIRRLQAMLDQTLLLEKEQAAAAPASASTPPPPTNPAPAPPAKPSTANQIARLNAEAAKIRTDDGIAGMRNQIAQAKKEIEARNADQDRIQKEIANYQQRLERLPVREQQLAQVTRDHAAARENYQSLLVKKQGADMATELERRQKSERFTLIEPARVPDAPTSPDRHMLNMISAGLSLLFSAVIGVLFELRKGKLLGEWELPPSVVVLAHLPVIKISNESRWKTIFRRPGKVGMAAASVLLIGAVGLYLTVLR